MHTIISLVVKLLVLVLFITNLPQLYSQHNIVMRCGVFFDSENAVFKENVYIKIIGNKISDVSSFYVPTANDTLIDLSTYSVMPGLIDAHTHFLHNEFFDKKSKRLTIDTFILSHPDQRLQMGTKNLKSYLMAGFTSIRDLGNSGNYLDIECRTLAENSTILSPRIFTSGKGIAFKNGQFPPYYQYFENQEYLIITDSTSVKNAIVSSINNKVDLIKIYADNAPNKDLMPESLMSYIVYLAHANGLKVTAHAIYDRSAQAAARSGVDCIEHVYNVSDLTLKMIEEQKIVIVPTFEDKHSAHKIVKSIPKMKLLFRIISPFELKKNRKILRKFYNSKLIVCTGSDAYLDDEICEDRGKFAKSGIFCLLDSKIDLGLALQSTTFNTAQLLGQENLLGVLKAGAFADIIATKGDVRKKPSLLRNVSFVMKNGSIFRQ